MFKINDRVKLDGDHMEHYMDGAICTVVSTTPDNDSYANRSDTYTYPEPFWIRGRYLTHVTNVPTAAPAKAAVRTFDTGATRDTDENKLDFEGFLSPLVLEEFAKYMHKKRKMPDGSMRDSDNWQKGIPVDAYMKSMWRHFFAVWRSYRRDKRDEGYDYAAVVEELLALLFNVQGITHEILKEAGKR